MSAQSERGLLIGTEGREMLPGSFTFDYRRGHLVLPGALPGVTWWCYLVLPGVAGVAWERGECYSTISGVHLLDKFVSFPVSRFLPFHLISGSTE